MWFHVTLDNNKSTKPNLNKLLKTYVLVGVPKITHKLRKLDLIFFLNRIFFIKKMIVIDPVRRATQSKLK